MSTFASQRRCDSSFINYDILSDFLLYFINDNSSAIIDFKESNIVSVSLYTFQMQSLALMLLNILGKFHHFCTHITRNIRQSISRAILTQKMKQFSKNLIFVCYNLGLASCVHLPKKKFFKIGIIYFFCISQIVGFVEV